MLPPHRPVLDRVATTDIAEWERRVWERRADQLNVTPGQGTVRWTAPIGDEERTGLDPDLLVEVDRCEQLTGVAVPIDLPAGRVVGVHYHRREELFAALAGATVLEHV